MPINNLFSVSFLAVGLLASPSAVAQQNTADEAEIRIGNIMPYTGPMAAFATIGKAEAAFFEMVNERGGINGRKIKFMSVDAGSNPGEDVARTRELVEKEKVLLLYGRLCSPARFATRK